jgi:hypothetical protein
MLKSAPFLEILNSLDPADMAITITTNNWDRILPSLKNLNKIQACQTVKEIDLWQIDNSYSSNKSRQVFSILRLQASAECN